jgi:hypothetical protein
LPCHALRAFFHALRATFNGVEATPPERGEGKAWEFSVKFGAKRLKEDKKIWR